MGKLSHNSRFRHGYLKLNIHRICMKSKRIERHKSKNITSTDLTVSFNECDRRANDENVKFGSRLLKTLSVFVYG